MQDECSKNTGQTSDDGMTCEPFRLSATGESICICGGSHVRILASQGSTLELTENALVCGRNTRESLAVYDRHSSSWRTSQLRLRSRGLDRVVGDLVAARV